MVKANNTLYKSANVKKNIDKSAVDKATIGFNEWYGSLSENQINRFQEIGYNKDRLLKGYLADRGALGFKAMFMNKDNPNTISAKLVINSVKKWASSLFKKD